MVRMNVLAALITILTFAAILRKVEVRLALLLLTVPQFGLTTRWLPEGLSVLETMLIGTVPGMLVTWTDPTRVA